MEYCSLNFGIPSISASLSTIYVQECNECVMNFAEMLELTL